MLQYTLIIALVLALSLAIAAFALGKTRPALAAAFGLTPILLMQIVFRVHDYRSLQACVQSACELQGLPADCGAKFGCDEGSGYVLAMLTLAGFAQLITYSLGILVISVIHSRQITAARTARRPAHDQAAR